ncbi:ABC transporter permease [Nafulsella turpanensis]|uniref:ABC transporter permease n=1 Tax=Nafulsella turpanensis TaxID=1265690 RepID=UPI00034C6E4A|nr:ABC transporter permease subunit [Nafulsella turpanensis]
MIKIFKYSFYDLLKSRWSVISLLFYLAATFGLLYLNMDLSKSIISLMNIVLFLAPLTAIMFGVIYFYNSRDFMELLLAQPLKRSSVLWGLYLGLATSLSLSFLIGMGVPFLSYGILVSGEIWNFMLLIFIGVLLTFIFSAIAFLIALRNENKTKGFGLSLLLWLFTALMYDGIFLLILIVFQDYPLEKLSLALTLLNPIDLLRISMMLKLDVSALFGFSGAVFNKFLGQSTGILLSIGCALLWVVAPLGFLFRSLAKKDF